MGNVRRLLAAEGTTFDRSFVNFSLCCPSRATFFTGQYAHNHGVRGNDAPLGGYRKLDKSNWLPLWLQRAGYRTIHLGKFLNHYGTANSAEVPPGWSEWYGSVDPSTYNYYGYTLNQNGLLVNYGADRDPAFYQTDFYGRLASNLIARNAGGGSPFFLSVGFLAPHSGKPKTRDDPNNFPTPDPAPRHRNRFARVALPRPRSFNELDVRDKPRIIRRRGRLSPATIAAIRENYQQELESLLAVDDAVARIVDALKRSGELDNTLVIFTTDNAFFHGEHRIRDGKILVYEPSIHLPLIMRGPHVPRGAHRRQLVTNADLAPTILDAANAKPGRVEDGRSLLPLLRDRGREWGRELLVEGGDGTGSAFDAVRNYRFLYAEYLNGDRELYDLRRDPDELRSRHAAPSYARIRAGLARRLAVLRTCRGRGCRAKPHLKLRVRPRRRCVRSVKARVIGSDRRLVTRVDFFVRKRRVARDRRAPFVKRVSRRRVPRGRRFRLRARATLADGRLVTIDRRLRGCRRR
jgi:arylsulfatase A-like enzyme